MAKRTNIRRRGKSWVAVYRVEGRQVWRSYPTREQAELHMAQVNVQRARHELRAPVRVTFGEALDEWLRHAEHERELKPSTLRDYRSAVEKWLRPTFGSARLEQISSQTIERWRADAMQRSDDPLPRRQAEKLLAILHGVFVRARRAYGFTGNPAADVERLTVKYDGAVYDFYAPEEVHALVRAAASDQDGSIFLTAAFTGLRRGELCALRIRDLDFGAEAIRVEGNIDNGARGTTKSGRARSVPMQPAVAQALARLLERPEYRGDDDPVFVGEAGGYVDGSALRRRFKLAQRRAGLRPLRFHDLRHTFGSLAAPAAESPRELQEWMGHADMKTTARYTHYRSRGGEAARLAEAFKLDAPVQAGGTLAETLAAGAFATFPESKDPT